MSQTKIALVTGGSRGLGKDMALNIAKKGLDVVLTYNSKKESADEVVKEIQGMGQKAAALELNVSDVASFNGFISEFQKILKSEFNLEKFDFLINNAGFSIAIPSFAETTEEQFDGLMNVHLKGVFFLTQKALTLLNDGGGIINISSFLTRSTNIGSGAYASAKSGVETLTRYLAKELGKRGIRVNVVAPGAVATDNSRLKTSPQMQEMIKNVTALNRIGLTDDISGIVAFLCTDDAKWITAQRIEASGGLYL